MFKLDQLSSPIFKMKISSIILANFIISKKQNILNDKK